jgi:crotonobetainyl-CoA:carnitine CoA-transferase CaiB-like acyl-CoA transferase
MGCQRGKRDIAIDLKKPEGRELALELVATADMVHHNMTLGTAEKLGVGYEDCKAVNPDILYCNVFMYGRIGPLAHMGGLDPLGQAACGIEWEQGPVAAGNPPMWYRYGHGDVAAAMPSALALLIALYHRRRTGEGQSMWATLFHGSQLYTADAWLGPDGTPSPRPTLDAEQKGLDALYRLYETSDGWIQLAAVKEEHWPALCTVIRKPELADDTRFATVAARAVHRDELAKILETSFAGDLAVNWRRTLDAAGVPCEISVDTWDGETILFDSELEQLGLVARYDHPLLGHVSQAGNLITFSDTPGKQERAAPLVGQHTREIMRELGYGDEMIDGYAEQGIVSWPGPDYHWPV